VKYGEGLVVNKRRRKSDATLFPGHQLQEPVYNIKAGSTLVGQAFETATESLLGGDRRTTDGTADICPDAIDQGRKLWIEAKATQRQHAFKVVITQMECYDNAQYDAAVWSDYWRVLYCLWAYDEKRITKPRDWSTNCAPDVRRPTKEELIRLVLGATTHVHVLDISVLMRIRERCEHGAAPATCSVKDYASWAGYHNGESYYVLNVGHKFLARLRGNVPFVLTELGLDPAKYRWRLHSCKPFKVTINSMDFSIPSVPAFELLRPEEWIDHADAKEIAPF